MESLLDTKHSENRYKVIFHRDLPSIPADARLIEVAFSCSNRCLGPSVVRKPKKLAARQAFVIRTICILFAIRPPRYEPSANGPA